MKDLQCLIDSKKIIHFIPVYGTDGINCNSKSQSASIQLAVRQAMCFQKRS